MTLDIAAVTAFIDGYRRTFETFDVDAIAHDESPKPAAAVARARGD